MLSIAVNSTFRTRLYHLDKKMTVSTLHGFAPGSRKNFKTHVKTYVRFCLYYGLDLFPADILQERRYIQYLSEFYKSVDSSKGYLAGMRSLHEIFGFKGPPADDHLYQLTISSIRRDKGHVVRQALPLTPEILVKMCDWVNTEDGVQLYAWVAILSGFYLLFRKSNLVPDTCTSFSAQRQLVQQNLVRMKDCYVARVFWSKTIQFNDRCLEVPMLPNIDRHLCPVFWLDYYLSRVPGRGSDPAFAVQHDGVNVALSYNQLTYWLKEWAEQVGLDKSLVSSQGIWRGGAQWAAHCSLPSHVIKILGDWKSSAFERYLDMMLQERYDAMLVFNMSMQ